MDGSLKGEGVSGLYTESLHKEHHLIKYVESPNQNQTNIFFT